jgi:pilus assembly protein Flp/PilA
MANQMLQELSKLSGRFRRDDRGVTLIEYGIALIMAITVGAAGLSGLGGTVQGKIEAACNTLDPGSNC